MRLPPAGRIDLAALCLLALLSGLILCRELGGGSLAGDETIFAQVGRGAARGELLPLRFGGTLFLAKPPLFPWMVGLDFRLLGVSEQAARLPAALSGVALVLLVYLAGAALFSRLAGSISALVLLTSFNLLFTHGLRKAVADGQLTLCLSAALLLYLHHRTSPEVAAAGRSRSGVVVACGLLLGLGLLLKSAVALLGVGVVGLFVCLFPLPGEGGLLSPRRFRDPLLLTAVALALFLPWLAAMELATHGAYARFLFGVDLLARATRGIDPGHVRHGVYWQVLLVDFRWKLLLLLPVPFLLAWRGREPTPGRGPEVERVAFLALWAAVVLGVFAAAVSQLPWYVYPAYPALALLLGWSVDSLYRLLWRPLPRGTALRAMRLLWLVVVGVVLARGLWRSWQAAGEDVAAVDAKRIEVYLHRLGNPLTCVQPGTEMREWNAYYLLPLCQRYVYGPADSSGCQFVITKAPEGYLPPEQLARRARKVSKYDPREGDVWLLSLRRDLPDEILHAPPPRPEVAY